MPNDLSYTMTTRQKKYKQKVESGYWRGGLTQEQYDQKLKDQGGCCAICGDPPDPVRPLYSDHDHYTNKRRGLLCASCNTKLSGVDDVEWLEKAIDYVHKWL